TAKCCFMAWNSLLSRSGVEHQNPIVLVAPGRSNKLLKACVGILTDEFPCSVARIVPLSLHWRAAELVHVNADGLAASCVGNDEASVFRSCRDEAIRAAARLRREHRLVGNHFVPGPLLEQPAHQPHLASSLVGDCFAPVLETILREGPVGIF